MSALRSTVPDERFRIGRLMFPMSGSRLALDIPDCRFRLSVVPESLRTFATGSFSFDGAVAAVVHLDPVEVKPGLVRTSNFRRDERLLLATGRREPDSNIDEIIDYI